MVLYVSVILKTALEYVVISFSSQRYSISYMSSLFDHWWVSEGMLADLSSAMIRFVQMKKMICEHCHGILYLMEMNRQYISERNIPEQSNFSGDCVAPNHWFGIYITNDTPWAPNNFFRMLPFCYSLRFLYPKLLHFKWPQ